nr:hypothetical protein [Tanacetum cinerariifolium]
MQTIEETVDTSKALDAILVNIESSKIESNEHNTSSRSGNDTHTDDANIRPIYDEETMVEVQTTTEINVFATGQQHTEQPEFNNEGEGKESSCAKPNLMIASSSSRYSSNDMVHNHYIEEAKKKIQEIGTSINVQEEHNLDLSAGTPFNLKKEIFKAWTKENVISGMLRPNGKLIHNSIINGPYVRRMIPKPGDTNCEVPVNETFHVQTDDELTKNELKQIQADDQAIQTILLGLPEDIYAAVVVVKPLRKSGYEFSK